MCCCIAKPAVDVVRALMSISSALNTEALAKNSFAFCITPLIPLSLRLLTLRFLIVVEMTVDVYCLNPGSGTLVEAISFCSSSLSY